MIFSTKKCKINLRWVKTIVINCFFICYVLFISVLSCFFLFSSKKMRKEFNIQKESFLIFSASLVAGDTAILSEISAVDNWLECISGLLRRGIVVRTPNRAQLDVALCSDAGTMEQITRLGAAMDRKATIRSWSMVEKERAIQVKKSKGVLEAKVHQMIEEEGLGVVEACRKVHCRPSDYYIYRSKQKAKNHGR